MSDITETESPPAIKKSKMPIIIGLVLLVGGAGSGFLAVKTGLFAGGGKATETTESPPSAGNEFSDVAFVALDPFIISLANGTDGRLLRFVVQLDVNPTAIEDVEKIKPRITDILNGYLRALEVSDLEAPAALTRIRSQMLHRVQIVAGENRVNDLLVMEFVIN